MITKIIVPIMDGTFSINGITAPIVMGTRVEYRILGLLFYRKIMYTPARYGLKEWQFTPHI